MVRVAALSDLAEDRCTVVRVDGMAIALFRHEGAVHAVDNRCPHMGFPLSKGTVKNGVLTCHWHHARFDLACGATFDPFADDVQSFPVEVRGEDVWLDPAPELEPAEARWTARLERGMKDDLRLVIAKSILGLAEAGAPVTIPLRLGLRFGAMYRSDGWIAGHTILAAMGNLMPSLRREDRLRALYQGLLHVADDCSGSAPHFALEAFRGASAAPARLKTWYRECCEVRDRDGAERVLLTAVAGGASPDELADMLYTACTDHLYMDGGHSLDFINKALEALDIIGWDNADVILPSLVPRLTDAARSEEQSAWRQPVDLADMLFAAFDELPGLAAAGGGAGEWNPPEDFQDILLGSDPAAIVDSLIAAVRGGAGVEALAAEVVHAAVRRVARFSVTNEFGDWNSVHHTFTYANSIHSAAGRAPSTALYRGVFDAAINLYLDRFLNSPPAPDPRRSDQPAPGTPDSLLARLLEQFNSQQQVDQAARTVAAYFAVGGGGAELRQTLGHALLREDADFHSYQMVEAAVRQSALAGDSERGELALIAAARYLAAHFPTRRASEQTFRIAERLHRGEALDDE